MDTPAAPVNLTASTSVDGLWQRLQFALLPPHCLLCGARATQRRDLCDPCAADLVRNRSCCGRCALPLPNPAALCGDCLKREPAFDTAFAPFLYAHPLDLLLTQLKFGHSLAAGRVLSELWLAELRARIATPDGFALPDLLVPVPLHSGRLRERGYNQALELAKPLSRELQIPLAGGLLQRPRATPAQSNLDAKTRHRNLRGAFEFAAPATDGNSRRGNRQTPISRTLRLPRHIALIDDVMTTGATLRECARMLKRAGIERVDVWALARAPRLR